jgi:predicted kinase
MEKKANYIPLLVLMAGLPGAGKTTLASELGRVLHWTVLDKDLLKLSLLRLQLGMPEEEIGRISYELLFNLAKDILVRQQSSVILDTSARHPFILKHASQIAQAAGVQLKAILCTASCSVRRERLTERVSSILHHPFMSPMDTTTIENDLECFQHLPEDKLIIETSYPLEDSLEKAIKYLLPSEKGLSW